MPTHDTDFAKRIEPEDDNCSYSHHKVTSYILSFRLTDDFRTHRLYFFNEQEARDAISERLQTGKLKNFKLVRHEQIENFTVLENT